MLCHENISKKIISQLIVDQKFIFDFITKESKRMILMDLEVQEKRFFIKL